MEPTKIRGTWRWVDANGMYHRGTDEEYQAYLNGNPVVEQPVVIEEIVAVEPAPIEEVYSDGLFDAGNEPA